MLFASQAAVAIANARTYRSEQHARADLEALVETSPVGVVVFDAKSGRPVSQLDRAEMREFHRIIAEQARHMGGLIGDLLDAGRIDSGTLSVAPEPSGLPAWWSGRAARSSAPAAGTPSLSTQVYLTNERPLAPSSLVVAVSALRFLYRVRSRSGGPSTTRPRTEEAAVPTGRAQPGRSGSVSRRGEGRQASRHPDHVLRRRPAHRRSRPSHRVRHHHLAGPWGMSDHPGFVVTSPSTPPASQPSQFPKTPGRSTCVSNRSRRIDRPTTAGRPCEMFIIGTGTAPRLLRIVTTARAPNRANRPRRSPMRFLEKRRGAESEAVVEARLLDKTLPARGDATREHRAGSKRHNRGNRPGAVPTLHADTALPGNRVRPGTPARVARNQSAGSAARHAQARRHQRTDSSNAIANGTPCSQHGAAT